MWRWRSLKTTGSFHCTGTIIKVTTNNKMLQTSVCLAQVGGRRKKKKERKRRNTAETMNCYSSYCILKENGHHNDEVLFPTSRFPHDWLFHPVTARPTPIPRFQRCILTSLNVKPIPCQRARALAASAGFLQQRF